MMGYIISPSYRDLQERYFPNILLYMRICIPQYQGSHILPQHISGLLQSLFLSTMVLLLFISPQYGSFAYPPPWQYLFLCHISPRPHNRGSSPKPVSFNGEKAQCFLSENYRVVYCNAKKAFFRPMIIYSHWQQEAVLWIFLIYEFYIYHLFTSLSYTLFFQD